MNEDAGSKTCILWYLSQQCWKHSHWPFSGVHIYLQRPIFLSTFSSIGWFIWTPQSTDKAKTFEFFYLFYVLLKCLHIFQVWIPKLIVGLWSPEVITCTETRHDCKYNKYKILRQLSLFFLSIPTYPFP